MTRAARKAQLRFAALGRYLLFDAFASGGMASVHLGRLVGPAGFSRTVAIKRLHTDYAKDPELAAMLLDEARLASRIRHPNVAATIDVVANDGELFLVMEYVHGESLSALMRIAPLPAEVAARIVIDALYGLHAAHEATDERGESMGLVHRDVSPQNVLVGVDGGVRVIDFGVAKAISRTQTTRNGQVKGKLAYMAPEQLRRRRVDRRTDIFAASVVLWEALTGRRLFQSEDAGAVVAHILAGLIEPPRVHAPHLPPAIDPVVMRGLARKPEERFETAREMALALEAAIQPAPVGAVGDLVAARCSRAMTARSALLATIEATSPEELELAKALDRSGLTLAPSGRAARASEVTAVEGAPPDARVVAPPGSLGGKSKRVATVAALACVFALLAGAAAVRGAVRTSPPRASSSAAPSPAEASAHDVLAASSVANAPSSPASAAASSAPAPSAAPLASPAIPPSVPPAVPTSVRNRQRPEARASDCDPPYEWDAVRRVKVFKEKCLR